jgi:hypothetical protein
MIGLDRSLASDRFEGVADVVIALSAWVVDPGGNTIGLFQPEGRSVG